MGALFQVTGIRWRELLRAVWGRALGTNVANRAAELAFWFLMGFFPMLVAVTSMVAMISSRAGSQATLMTYLGKVLPSGAASLVSEVLTQTTGSGKALLSFFFALWSSSSATAGIIDTLNAIYGQTERRPWWKYRVIAVALAIATGILLTAALIIVVYSPIILNKVLPGTATLFVWKLTQWPAAALLLIMALLGIYRFAPNVQQQHWKWLLPGSVTAAVIWMAVSLLFKVYVRHFSHFGLLYGSLGALIILMFWFYLSGVAILVGGVINAVLSDAAERTDSGIA
jgi:membrane protein